MREQLTPDEESLLIRTPNFHPMYDKVRELVRKAFEADQRGYLYHLFVDDHPRWGYDSKEGFDFIAESDEVAIDMAHKYVPVVLKVADMYMKGSTHGFRLFHRDRLVFEYEPPSAAVITSR